MARSRIFKTRPESGEPPAARRAGSRAMTTLDFSVGAALATSAPAKPARRRPLRVTPCCGPMRMALAPGAPRLFQVFRFIYSTRRGSRPGGDGCLNVFGMAVNLTEAPFHRSLRWIPGEGQDADLYRQYTAHAR